MKTTAYKRLLLSAIVAFLPMAPILSTSAHADTKVVVGANIGLRLPNGSINVRVGQDHYHYNKGRYYKKTPRGYVVVRAPRGAIIRDLPRGYTRIVVGGRPYYRYAGVYYVREPRGYVVVEKPEVVVVEKETSITDEIAPENTVDDYSVWLNGEQELVMKSGQFFRRTPQGLVWVDLPVGAVANELPPYAETIWYEESEYFEKDGVHFKKTPNGYKIVPPPWEVQ